MYDFAYFDDVESIPQIFFDIDTSSISSLYRTRTWLRVSQWRLGDESYYIGIWENDKPIALAPMVTFSQPSDYSTTNPHLVASDILKRTISGTVNYCATLFGVGQPIIHRSANVDWTEILKLIRLAAWKRTGSKVTVIGWFTRFDTIGNLSTQSTYQMSIGSEKTLSVLNLQNIETFEDFLSSVPSKIRVSYRHDIKKANLENIIFKDVPGSQLEPKELGTLATNVMERYGNVVPPERIESFIREITNAPDIDSGAVMAFYEGKTIGYTLYMQVGSTFYAHTYGRSFEKGAPNPYFGLGYTTLISAALKHGASYLNYGAGAGNTKTARGITTVPAYAIVSDNV